MIEWSDEISVGIDEFDNHHKRIIHLINSLDETLETDAAKKTTHDALAELSNYCIYHFLPRKMPWRSVTMPNSLNIEKSIFNLFKKSFSSSRTRTAVEKA